MVYGILRQETNESMMSLQAPVFIVGYPRSGTTLLQCMLSAHSSFFSLPETHFFSEVLRRVSKKTQQQLTNNDVELIFEYCQHYLGISEEHQKRFLKNASQSNVNGKNIFEYIIDIYRPVSDINKSLRMIEKTPMHALFIEDIYEIYSGAKFINIIRDPRDAISSAMQLPVNTTKWLPHYVKFWNSTIEIVDTFRESKQDIVYSLRYEDLVNDSETNLRVVCDFLKVSYEPEMLSSFSKQYQGNIIEKENQWKGSVECGNIRAYKPKWQERITETQAWLIEIQANKLMRKYQYSKMATPTVVDKIKIIITTYKTARCEGRRALHWLRHFLLQMISEKVQLTTK